MMEIFHYNHEGVFVGPGVADIDPVAKSKGVERFLIPANATTVKPPVADPGYQAVFKNGAWAVSLVPEPQPEEDEDNRTLEEAAQDRRALMLSETDWYVIRFVEEGIEVPANVEAYRKALRDITKQAGYPDSIEWPVL